MTRRSTPPRVVNADDLAPTGTDADGGTWTRLAAAAGGDRLGCTLEVVAPGGSPSRYHFHAGTEEALFVLSGAGTLRTPAGESPIRAGDYAAFPAGEAGAHAVENTGEEPLRCLFVSAAGDPDVVGYPDEGTMTVVAGGAPTVEGEYVFEAESVEK